VRLDKNALLLFLSLATDIIVAAACIVDMVAYGGGIPFQVVIIEVYTFIAALLCFCADVYRPIVCSSYFSFLRYYWGRGLVYLFMGALVIIPSAPYPFFAGIWTWVVAFIFFLLAAIAAANKSEGGVEPFKQSMQEYGVAILTMDDEETRTAILEYLEVAKGFFDLSQEEKVKYSRTEELRKVNEGYLLVEGTKEFLKLKHKDSKMPRDDPELAEKFPKAWTAMHKICERLLEIVGEGLMDDGKPYIDPTLYSIVKEKMALRSSVSIIHYFPVERDPAGELVEGENLSVPSAIHQDTGLFTLILCSNVQGLEVQTNQSPPSYDGQESDEHPYLKVETMATVHHDLFCIMGRKIELFSRIQPPTYTATWHRVRLPSNTERYSTLFFCDVPQ